MHRNIFITFLIGLLGILPTNLFAQGLTQSIRGQIIDQQSQIPLPGAMIKILDSDPPQGALSDENGYFRIDNVAVGRVSLQITYIGYNPTNLPNLYLGSAKELILNVEMEERIATTEDVVITAEEDKTKALNEFSTVSARTFSVEESQRYAGARNDVARMAFNFAGVQGANDAVNDIVVRGNSPNGLLWRFEGVDIPNPNHFGDFGSTGGPVSMLNNNVLANSDFMTGAFPAEYGNALSGVFDLKMRNGNNEKHEFMGQIGFNGFEAGLEGPISRKKHSSYLVNYRYSTLGVLAAMGVNFGTGTAVPYYQDLSFKLNFPTEKLGKFTVFGIGGLNSIDLVSSTDTDEDGGSDFYGDEQRDIYVRNQMGVAGISHTYLFNPTTYSKITLAGTIFTSKDFIDSLDIETRVPSEYYRQRFIDNKIYLSWFVNKKFSAQHNLKAGIIASRLGFDLQDSVYISSIGRFLTQTNTQGSTYLLQPYIQYQYRPTDNITVNAGLHYQHLTLNNTYSVEPRIGARWQFAPNQSLNFGYGLHSRIAPLLTYFSQVEIQEGQYIKPNEELEFTKSHHLVLGYDWSIKPNLRIKAEAYYQHLFDVPVDANTSSFSVLNAGTFANETPDSLSNNGTGTNYGIELTFEKFLDKGFYFLFTTSLYNSKYVGSDQVERNTAFNSNYIFNLLGGKEFNLNANKPNAKRKYKIALDGKVTVAGGRRYSPIDVEASLLQQETVYVDAEAYSLQFQPYFRADIRAAFRMEAKKASQEFAINIENVSNRANPFSQFLSLRTGDITTINQLGLFPVVQYKVEF